MKKHKIDPRLFIKSTALAATGVAITGNSAFSVASSASQNKLPRWKGFNLLDYLSADLPRNNYDDRTQGIT